MKEWLLMTDAVRSVFSTHWVSKPNEHESVVGLLKNLDTGQWRKKPAEELGLKIWVAGNGEIRYSAPVDEGNTLIWETLNTFDVPQVIERGREGNIGSVDYVTPHIILHQVKASNFTNVERLDLDGIEYLLDTSGSIGLLPDSDKDELVYNRELYYLTPRHYDNILLGIQKGLWLHLTREQASILKRDPGPLLLSGEAGSGKTTIVTLWLFLNLALKESDFSEKQLFVTFSERLKEKTEEDFNSMLDQKYMTDDNPDGVRAPEVEFKTYQELLREIAELGNFGHEYPKEKEMDLPTFIDVYASRIIQEGLDPYLVWDEIRGVTKGGWNLGWERTTIDLEEYEKLNTRKAKCKIPSHLRKEYWNASKKYNKYLSKEGLWDSIDLARRCYLEFIHGNMMSKFPLYERLACDEVQDLSPIEIRLLIQILDDEIEREGGDRLDRLFLTGDKAQVINPSGFNWETLKLILYEESQRSDVIKDPINLERNFRCTEQIVTLANLAIQSREEMQLSCPAERQTSMKTGEFPRILSENPLGVMRELGNQGKVNPERRLIIVKNVEQKERLIERLNLENENDAGVPLTVEEAKGLEWHSSLLWNFFVERDDTKKNPWNYVFDEKQKGYYLKATEQSEMNRYTLEHEFNLLHVAITRSREEIYIYDENAKLNFSHFNGIDEVTMPIGLDEFREEYKRGEARTPESLRRTAKKLRLTNRLQSTSLYLQAGKLFREKSDFTQAAECFALTTEFGEFTDSKIAKLPDLANRHELAADMFSKCEDELNSLYHTANFHLARKDHAKAAEHFTRHGLECEKDKRWGLEAARKSFEEARALFETRLKDTKAARKATLDIAKIYERQGKTPEAINQYKAAITHSTKLGDIKVAYDIISRVCKTFSGSIEADMLLLKAEIKAEHESAYRDAATGANTAYQIYKEISAVAQQKTSLRKAIQYSDLYNHFSIDYRKLLIGLEKETAPQSCRNLWKEIIDYHIKNGDIATSWTVLKETSTYLFKRKMGRAAIDDLNKYGSEYSKRSSNRELILSLERVTEILLDLEDFDERCRVNQRLAKIHRDHKDQEKARRFIENAAFDALRTDGVDSIERANNLFDKCRRWILKENDAGQAGFFCLQTVVYEYGLRDWDAEKEKTSLDYEIGIKAGINQIDFLVKWIDNAAVHYVSAGKRKFISLDSAIRTYASRGRSSRLKKEDRLKFCWTLYCKGMVISKKGTLSKRDYEQVDSIMNQAIGLVLEDRFKLERDFFTRQRKAFQKASQESAKERDEKLSLKNYKRHIILVMSDDGQIDEREESWLALTREQMGISKKEHKAVVKEVTKELRDRDDGKG